MTPDEAQELKEQLFDAAAKGQHFETFLASEPGREVVGAFDDELASLIEELIEGKGNDVEIRAKIWLIRRAKASLADVIIRGYKAVQIIEGREDGYG